MTDDASGADQPGDVPERPADPPEVRDRWLLVAVAGALAFVAMLDMNIVNVVLADISQGLRVSAATAQWAVLGYQLPVVALLLPVGRWLDTVGTRPALLVATGGFALCSALAAASPWAAWLIAARIGQGMCGAVLFVLMPVLAIRSVRPELRGRAMSVPATLGPLGAVTGPAVGGLLLDHLGWRWIFLVNVPLAALAIVVILRVLHVPHQPVRHRLDYGGALTLAVGIVPLLIVAEQGRSWGWGSPRALVMYAVGVVGLVSFVLLERRMADAALLPVKLFRIRAFRLGTVLHFTVGITMFGAMTTLPLYLQLAKGMSPMKAGLATLPTMAANVTVTLAVGRLMSRTGRFKVHLVAGVGSLTVSMLVFATLRDDSPLWYVAIGMVFMGAGLGAAMQTITTLAQSEVPGRDMGAATASVNFFRSNGGTVGAAAFLSILFSLAGSRIGERLAVASQDASFRRLAGEPANAEALKGVLRPDGGVNLEDSAFLRHLDPGVAQPFLEGYVSALRVVFLTGAAVGLIAFVIAAWRVPNTQLSAD
ncbi:MFS transporter [Streptomyces antimycoticus]|uniref:MFS transporter n=1 Tax=Streptomyces antimycoticus TaxID=68175 RepID=UPI001EECFB63|nr:MFS transporter [Streptomyces antimycoticus]